MPFLKMLPHFLKYLEQSWSKVLSEEFLLDERG